MNETVSQGRRENETYALGETLFVAHDLRLREGEELSTAEVVEIKSGDQVILKARGVGEGGRRALVSVVGSGVEGWLSITSGSGMPLVSRNCPEPKPKVDIVIPSGVPPPLLTKNERGTCVS